MKPEDRFSLAKEMYAHIQNNIRRLDEVGLKFKYWAIILWGIIIGFAINNKDRNFLFLAWGIIVLIYITDIINKFFHQQFLEMNEQIEKEFCKADPSKIVIDNLIITPHLKSLFDKGSLKVLGKVLSLTRIHTFLIYYGLFLFIILLYFFFVEK